MITETVYTAMVAARQNWTGHVEWTLENMMEVDKGQGRLSVPLPWVRGDVMT